MLFLRTSDPDLDPEKAPLEGNVLVDRLVGAEIRLITPATYRDRNAVMASAAAELRAAGKRPYVIPEGGSSGLGSLGYVEAMAEVRRQLDQGLAGGKPFDVIVHACGSGGTAAGVALGAAAHGVAAEVRAMAVCDDAATFEAIIARIIGEARALEPGLTGLARPVVDDRAKGPAYAVSTPEQRRKIVEVARLSGLILDPVYTGKAFAGLADLAQGELAARACSSSTPAASPACSPRAAPSATPSADCRRPHTPAADQSQPGSSEPLASERRRRFRDTSHVPNSAVSIVWRPRRNTPLPHITPRAPFDGRGEILAFFLLCGTLNGRGWLRFLFPS